MFPDSDIARSYSMTKTKLSYVINFGIATHFRTLLLEKLVKSKFYTVCFDESLNEAVQKCHMDFSLRFWVKTANEAVVQDFFRFKCSRSCVCPGLAQGISGSSERST